MPNGPEFGKRIDQPTLPHRTFPIKSKGPRGLQKALSPNNPPGSGPLASIPQFWTGDVPEWFVYWALVKLGKQPNVDFFYQSDKMGGRQFLGGAVVDFIVDPGIGINVQGEHFHYEAGTAKIAADKVQAINLEGHGLHMVFIDAEPLMADASGQAAIDLVSDALRGIDHSQFGMGLI